MEKVLEVVFLGGSADCVTEVGAVGGEYVPVWVDGSSRNVTVVFERGLEGVVWGYPLFPHSLSLHFSECLCHFGSRVLLGPYGFGVLFFLICCVEFIIQFWESGLKLREKFLLWVPFNKEKRGVGGDVWEEECGNGLDSSRFCVGVEDAFGCVPLGFIGGKMVLEDVGVGPLD